MRSVAVFLALAFIQCQAYASDFGAGFILGDPTGLSAEYRMNKSNAIDGAVAWRTTRPKAFHFHSDYLWLINNVFSSPELPLDLHLGVGGRILFFDKHPDGDDVGFGPRFPIGLNYTFKHPQIEVFLEVALVFELVPDTDADLDFGIGARYYF